MEDESNKRESLKVNVLQRFSTSTAKLKALELLHNHLSYNSGHRLF